MINTCNDTAKVKFLFLVKKGMASKALINNLKTGNADKLTKQVRKGTVIIHRP